MPDSRSPYIIICNGRIETDLANSPAEMIAAASRSAMNLVSYYGVTIGDQITSADTQPISDLQHYLMDNRKTMSKAQVKAKVAEMFALLDALEEKFEG